MLHISQSATDGVSFGHYILRRPAFGMKYSSHTGRVFLHPWSGPRGGVPARASSMSIRYGNAEKYAFSETKSPNRPPSAARMKRPTGFLYCGKLNTVTTFLPL